MLNTQRLTISLPAYLHELLLSHVEKRHLSQYVAKALEKELIESEIVSDPVDEFFALRTLLPKKSRTQIERAVKKGRE